MRLLLSWPAPACPAAGGASSTRENGAKNCPGHGGNGLDRVELGRAFDDLRGEGSACGKSEALGRLARADGGTYLRYGSGNCEAAPE